ncbi:MAG: PilT/PilU family type 4a pilus ATPase [Candidatus Omnitrophica bacterium]|nr:PilT/PilU family type 4a pilus ATPase [Candidatus Omnitrophota bacterium]
MRFNELTAQIQAHQATGMFLCADMPPLINVHGRLQPVSLQRIAADDVHRLSRELLSETAAAQLAADHNIHTTFTNELNERFRITFYQQRGQLNGVIRPIPARIPSFEELNLPEAVRKLAAIRRGLVIIGGSSGSGKSTTLAMLLNVITEQRCCHVITLEDPIEYHFPSDRAVFSQREIGKDCASYSIALRRAIRQDPDVIMLDELRDSETIQVALTAAETGILVLATMHATDAMQTITRIVSSFPAGAQQQASTQLSLALHAIVIQQLILSSDGTRRVPAVEILLANTGIRTLIRAHRLQQIYASMEAGQEHGMQSFNQSLSHLCQKNLVSDVEAISRSTAPAQTNRTLQTAPASSVPQKNVLPAAAKEGYTDLGEEMMPIDKKLIRYRAQFSPGLEGFWTSGGAVSFAEGTLSVSAIPGASDTRFYVNDFNIVSKKILSFPLPPRLLLRFRIETDTPQPGQLLVKFFTQPEQEKITAYHKINLSFPLPADLRWHTWAIGIPPAAQGKLLKIAMLEFPAFVHRVVVSDLLYF